MKRRPVIVYKSEETEKVEDWEGWFLQFMTTSRPDWDMEQYATEIVALIEDRKGNVHEIKTHMFRFNVELECQVSKVRGMIPEEYRLR